MRHPGFVAAVVAAIAIALLIWTWKPAHGAGLPVTFITDQKPGTIVVKTNERALYLVTGVETAIKYPVGVGRNGRRWSGTARIDGKYQSPPWQAPAELVRAGNYANNVMPGGSPKNPMGAAALTLTGGKYAIHGTNEPYSIGTFVSAGCIRMLNRDVEELYKKVHVGTLVLVEQ